jgi:NDP-sugar pyrophosphorylase family protein
MIDPGVPSGSDQSARHFPRHALVLTAGLGTRLRPLTYVRAKAAVPVNGETLARRAIRWLVSHGVRDLVLNLHHQPDTIAASVGDGSDMDARVRYSWEDPVLGSAGGPRHALPLLIDRFAAEKETGTFWVVNGDTLTDVDLAAMATRHHESGAAVTMALIPNPEPQKYGGVLISEDDWVAGFLPPGSHRPSYHFVGVQIVASRVFEALEDGQPFETVNALYPALMAREPHSLAAFVSQASFRDIGTPADYLRTSLELAAAEGDRMVSGHGTRIDPSARVHRSAVWDDVTIGAGAELLECVIGDGAVVPAGSRYRQCAIVPAAGRRPERRERIEGSLLVSEID